MPRYSKEDDKLNWNLQKILSFQALAKLPMPQPVGGELSLIPIEHLIQIEDIIPAMKAASSSAAPTSSSQAGPSTYHHQQQQQHYHPPSNAHPHTDN